MGDAKLISRSGKGKTTYQLIDILFEEEQNDWDTKRPGQNVRIPD